MDTLQSVVWKKSWDMRNEQLLTIIKASFHPEKVMLYIWRDRKAVL